jgi:biotin carboxyl carrier protein
LAASSTFDLVIARIHDQTYSVEWKDGQLSVNGEKIPVDAIETGPGASHFISSGKGYHIEVVSVDREAKTVEVRVNGKPCRIELRKPLDLVLEKMGMHAGASHRLNSIKAPMPGLIVGIAVQVGDAVKPGDTVLILEAMKMENVIKASGEGTVRKIHATKGDRVEKGHPLIDF